MSKSNKSKRSLGEGISALLSGINPNIEQEREEVVSLLANTIVMLPIANIEVNPYQPRVDFQPQALEELRASIQEYGLIQPITVRHLERDQYQLISGERRLRASGLAGLTEIPAYVRLADDEAMMQMALIENIQRQDLNAIEVALSFERLMKEFDLTQEQLSEKVGKDRSTVTNYVGLLRLPAELQAGVQQNKISMGHAKALKGLNEQPALQLTVYREVVSKELSVRQTEALVQRLRKGKIEAPKEEPLPVEHQKVEQNLSDLLSAKVSIKRQKDGKGQIVIHFMNDEHLNGILDTFEHD